MKFPSHLNFFYYFYFIVQKGNNQKALQVISSECCCYSRLLLFFIMENCENICRICLQSEFESSLEFAPIFVDSEIALNLFLVSSVKVCFSDFQKFI